MRRPLIPAASGSAERAERSRRRAQSRRDRRKRRWILEADGEAKALERVFQAVHANNADPKVHAYKYLEMLPHLAEHGNGYFVIAGEPTEAVKAVTSAFAAEHGVHDSAGVPGSGSTSAIGPVARR